MSNPLRHLGASAAALAASVLPAPAATAQIGEVLTKIDQAQHEAISTPDGAPADRIRITCSSGDYDHVTCRFPRGFEASDVRLVRRHSSADCDRGRDWDFRRDHLWVRDGCRAEFEVFAFTRRDIDLEGGPGWRGDDRRHDDRRYDDRRYDVRRDEATLRHLTGMCAREAVQEAWSQNLWSAQFERQPGAEWFRDGADLVGNVRVHHAGGYYTTRATCRVRRGEVVSFDFR